MTTTDNRNLFYYSEIKKSPDERNIGRRITLAGIVDGDTLRIGLAMCNKGDQFVKKLGRTIAMGRAKKKAFATTQIKNPNHVGKEFRSLCEHLKTLL